MNDPVLMTSEISPGEGLLKKSPPCSQCRQKKIKCDKQKPCQNCKKAFSDCFYQPDTRTPTDTYSELYERIQQLEARLQFVTSGLVTASPDANLTLATSTKASPELECHCGRQILGNDFSVHFDYYMHWVELFPKIRDTHFDMTVEDENEEGPKENYQPFLVGIAYQSETLESYQPPELEADFLVTVFFNNVDPFVRMVHKDTFLSDLSLFRKGKHPQMRTFTSLLFSVYGLAAASLEPNPNSIVATFGVERESILDKYQEAQEMALYHLDFINSNKIAVFQTFLYYLTFLFARGYYRTATTLLGLAARNAQRLGLHRDPSWFNYTPWGAEHRRRLWNQLILLDQRAIALQGAITVLGFAWDTKLPENVNDCDWNTSPFSKPSDAPRSTGAFSQMSTILLKRETLKVLCPLRQNLRSRSYDEQMRHIDAGAERANSYFTAVGDDMMSLATFAKEVVEIDCDHMRLMAGQAYIRFGQPPPSHSFENFTRALNMLQRLLSLEAEIINPGWMWLFRQDPPFLATSVVLTYLSSMPDGQQNFHAWTVINAIFKKFISIHGKSKPPIVASLEAFREQTKPSWILTGHPSI
ncbi:fungal-specific transcription factor domain-containing protein [Talaromyces proteolyticus]|uniref:Fungal-specific transcription factor domain-containing protein n=1 Tax=Talaromyces proteolyticus TaxID=1131652 RepID=A0AAD4Q453_9EURO|nr:fungal-specific transcription factor domain-containing protein [Talaromyces proteolyticus]KAH8705804.1 fungal-specific transcription factor domain-containing protein [Talaromyces proteolyticus]